MLIYVAHRYGGDPCNIQRARQIVHNLQISDTDNTYVCPLLALSSLEYGELNYDDEMELCLDLLMVCEKIIVASEISNGVAREIELANRINMEVSYLEDARSV